MIGCCLLNDKQEVFNKDDDPLSMYCTQPFAFRKVLSRINHLQLTKKCNKLYKPVLKAQENVQTCCKIWGIQENKQIGITAKITQKTQPCTIIHTDMHTSINRRTQTYYTKIRHNSANKLIIYIKDEIRMKTANSKQTCKDIPNHAPMLQSEEHTDKHNIHPLWFNFGQDTTRWHRTF